MPIGVIWCTQFSIRDHMYDPSFDPVAKINALGVRIVKKPLQHNDAIWIPHRKLVILDPFMAPSRVKPVLTHEYAHIINGDQGGHDPRSEARANLVSSLILTDPIAWEDLTRIHSDYDHICIELGLTREQFIAYHHHRSRRKAA